MTDDEHRLALHLRLFGDTLAPIYATQTLLSLMNVALPPPSVSRDGSRS